MNVCEIKIAVIGLGYVGFPLFNHFSTKFYCCGLDYNSAKIKALKEQIGNPNIASNLTTDWDTIHNSNIYIVAVPTPIDNNQNPDISSLKDVCEHLSQIIKHGDLIIFESTVYPGMTNEICIPILENFSKMKVNKDFSVGYSPERINVGDHIHQLGNTPKIISASNSDALKIMSFIYTEITSGEIIPAPSIKVAEAAKMYENIQRDLLIALANQYADYCRAEQIDIQAVTECASSKWNFCDVRPGLVGGHCISVDPYYLVKRAKDIGADVSLVKAARSINEQRAILIANRIINIARFLSRPIQEQSILFLGFSYKVNSSDIRNTKVATIIHLLSSLFLNVDCLDPLVDSLSCKKSYNIEVYNRLENLKPQYDMIIKIVPHKVFDNFNYPAQKFINLNDVL